MLLLNCFFGRITTKYGLKTGRCISLELSAYCESDAGNMCGQDGLMPNGFHRILDLNIEDSRYSMFRVISKCAWVDMPHMLYAAMGPTFTAG